MANAAEIEAALRKADAAGNVEDARRLAAALRRIRGSSPAEAKGSLSGGGIDPTQGRQLIPGLDPVQPGGGAPDPSVAAIEAEADAQPGTLGGMLARDVPRTARGVAQGLTFGTSDEMLAGARALAGENYGEALADERAELGRLGGARLPAEFLGSAPWMALGAGWIGRAKSLRGMAGRSSAVTGGTGTAYGAGTGEGGARNRVVNALGVGIPSAAVGFALPYGVAGGQSLARWTGNQLGSTRNALVRALTGEMPQFSNAANRKVVEGAMREFPGMSPEEAIAAANAERAAIGPEATYADVGPNLRGLTAATERAPGPAKTIIRDKIIPRQEGARDPETQVLQGGQAGRVDEFLNKLVPESVTKTRQVLSQSTDEVGNLYGNAYAANQHMDSPEIRRILKTPLAKRAFRYAVQRMQNRGQNASRNDPELTAIYRELVDLGRLEDVGTRGVGRGLKLRTLDLVKRALDDMGSASPTATGTAKGMASDARALAKQLRNELDRLDETAKAGPKSLKADGGDYAKARKIEEARFAAKEALMDGEKFLVRGTAHSPDELRAAIRDMTPDELEKMRISFVGALKTRAGDTKRWLDATRNLYGDKNLEDKIRLVFGDDETFARYIRFLEGSEAPMFQTYSAITKGSPTALRLAEDADAKKVPGLLMEAGKEIAGAPLSPGAWVRGLGKAGRAAGQRLARDPASMRIQVANALMGPNLTPQMTQRAAGTVRLSEANRRALAKALMGIETQRAREAAKP